MAIRKYGERPGWSRILKRRYTFVEIISEQFTGGASLLHLVETAKPLWVSYDNKKICIVDHGYMWLQHFPRHESYTVTTMFDHNGEVIQWYIDICDKHGIDDNGPWWDDLYLDIIVLPTGEYFLVDEEELEEALLTGQINHEKYNLAKTVAQKMINQLEDNNMSILGLALRHKNELIALLE
ncbi:MAG: DUF402 domain-containing protein [Psychrobacillus sp.]